MLVILAGIGLGMVQNQARHQGRFDPVSSAIRQGLRPITLLFDRWGDRATVVWGGVKDSEQLRKENLRLREQLAAASLYLESQERLGMEYDKLKALIDLPAEGKEKVYADIIAASPADNQFTINAGADKGLEENQPVVTSDGLLGIVGTVGEKSSQVMLLKAPSVKIEALVKTEPLLSQGIIDDAIGNRLLMKVFDRNPVPSGTVVMTTGYGAKIPRGIPIGVVLEISDDEQRGMRRAEVLPYAKLAQVQEVVVLK